MKSISQEIAELRQMKVPELAVRYEALFGKAPRVKHREWLWKKVAWKIQEQRYGGLSKVAKRRLEELIAEIDLPLSDRQRQVTGELKGPHSPGDPPPGTTLVREWHGREIRATAVDGGYECDGVVYKSLSAVAKAVTGAHWSGKLFFGLATRKK